MERRDGLGAGARLAAFGVALLAVFGVGYGAGAAVGPLGGEDADHEVPHAEVTP